MISYPVTHFVTETEFQQGVETTILSIKSMKHDALLTKCWIQPLVGQTHNYYLNLKIS
jgi:hypothetical protein